MKCQRSAQGIRSGFQKNLVAGTGSQQRGVGREVDVEAVRPHDVQELEEAGMQEGLAPELREEFLRTRLP
jgi:hypothetical protein